MKSNKNILLVDDHLVVRKGIELILKNEIENVTLYNVEDYDEAIEVIKAVTLDLILLDININGVENIKILQQIKSMQPNVRILIFSSHDEKQYGLRYVQNGADGYLSKSCSEDVIVKAVYEILEKGTYYSNDIKSKLDGKGKKASKNPIDRLSNREFEIAKLLISGYGNLEISNKLDIQMSTVSTYKNRVFEKLNITNVVSLADLFKENEVN